jgi:hypothetical protein
MTPGFVLFMIFLCAALCFAFGSAWVGTILLVTGLVWLLALAVIAALVIGLLWWLIAQVMGHTR